MNSTLYEHDFRLWIQQHIELLQQGRVNELDTIHLIEELQDMGRSSTRELESRLKILIAHLLKWQFQYVTLASQWQQFEGKSWRNTIIQQRSDLLDLLEDIPSLQRELPNAIAKMYPKAVQYAVDETGLSSATFPQICPYRTDLTSLSHVD
jgi:hypothetical protein